MAELITYAENTWCPGCGDFGILRAFEKAVVKLEERGTSRGSIMISAGIGCHAKIFDYLDLSGLYSLHGRAMVTVQGMKVANPDLKVVVFAGDGDAFGEGLAHMVFAAKRNANITVIVHDNSVYGLTTGQFTPTSPKGLKGPSTPKGSVEEPLNSMSLMLEAGATFVARCYSGKVNHMVDTIVQAVEHPGFAFVNVLQPCVTFYDTYPLYREKVIEMDDIPATDEEAFAQARRTDKLPIGVFRKVEKPAFHEALYGDWHPISKRMSMESRREAVAALLRP